MFRDQNRKIQVALCLQNGLRNNLRASNLQTFPGSVHAPTPPCWCLLTSTAIGLLAPQMEILGTDMLININGTLIDSLCIHAHA